MIGPSFPHVLVAAQRGDEQAFDLLWRDLHPAMLRYLQVMAPAAAEDLAADTWIGVIRELRRFVGDEPGFRAWVFTDAGVEQSTDTGDEPTADRAGSHRVDRRVAGART
jgi:RNA polymerase sigma-70 factor, ECF subfamily